MTVSLTQLHEIVLTCDLPSSILIEVNSARGNIISSLLKKSNAITDLNETVPRSFV